jgi:uncharacterized protein (DUF58 family)
MKTPDRAMTSPFAAPRWLARLGEMLTREHFSRYERYLRWARKPLTVLALAAIASALCGLFLHPQGFVLSFGLAALIAVGGAWPWFGVLGLKGILSFEKTRSREGEPVKSLLVLHNRSPMGAWGLAVHAGLGEGIEAGLSNAAGWRKTEVEWDFVPGRRGAYPEGVPRIASGFPFGLTSSSRALAVSNTLLVWPRTFAVGPIPRVAGGLQMEGNSSRNRAGGSGDFLGVRPYRRGDSLRRVHWPQTARLDQMVVCELQSNAVPRVQVVLDAHPGWHVGAGPDSSREWAIRIAASFLEAWIGEGAEIELVVEGRAIPARGGSVASRRAGMLDVLARIGPGGDMGLPELLEQPACRRFSGGLRVIVATDLAVSRLAPRPSRWTCERVVMLRSSAFGPDKTGSGTLESKVPDTFLTRPWAWIDDPRRVPQQVRRAWKEVVLGG